MKQIIACVIFLVTSISFSQQTNNTILGSTMWLKGVSGIASSTEIAAGHLFNFNPVVDFSQDIPQNQANIFNRESSIFVVFKDSSSQEKNILKMEYGTYKAQLTNRKLECEKDVPLITVDAKKGGILSYRVSNSILKGKKKGRIKFDDHIYSDTAGESQLMELLYIPQLLNDNQKNSVESYLSIKYGISLAYGMDYLNSSGGKIWNNNDNEGFGYRVTGIGRDDQFGLYQKQSGNSEKDGLYMGIQTIEVTNAANGSVLADTSFVFRGDNNGSIQFADNGRIERIWKLRTHSANQEVFNTRFEVDATEMGSTDFFNGTDGRVVWMVVDSLSTGQVDYSSSKYIKSTTTENGHLVFDNALSGNNSSYLFTFVKAPEFLVLRQVTTVDCQSTTGSSAKISIIGGTAPYSVHLKADNIDKEFTESDSKFEIADLLQGSYSIEISDQKHKDVKIFKVDPFGEEHIAIAPQWYLENDNALAIAAVITKPNLVAAYSWLCNEKIISTEKTLITDKAGNYKLILTSQLGCEKELFFEVLKKDNPIEAGWTIYPNPSPMDQEFTIQFHLEEASDVSVIIYDINGKNIKSQNLGRIKEYDMKEKLSVSGTYLVMVLKNNIASSAKLIIE